VVDLFDVVLIAARVNELVQSVFLPQQPTTEAAGLRRARNNSCIPILRARVLDGCGHSWRRIDHLHLDCGTARDWIQQRAVFTCESRLSAASEF